ncbi:MBL fold metallo-hydrolase [Epidermidibacterium keratini]|uniref:MBL fold metallo-hydrolase n=1 Tax=Epidermidibacterium keratini TaxID=1891644 RepID=A0A7L4YMX1_9ACTN|nr:MBL fold metallo-hydrolase [Epidermidibacterium keratini]QHC00402.1 MBL fold metallo-hydrolase [Epidermidibacterium keratini]
MADLIELGRHTTVLGGPDLGKYPSGNPLLVQGADSRVLIDSAVGVQLPEVDAVLLSHFHEDHTVGIGARPELPVQIHARDLAGVQTVEGFAAASGFPGEEYARELTEVFQHQGVAQAQPFADDAHWDLGGGVTITAVPLPGHTFGHSGFLIEPDGVFFTADVDLSSFGPFYGDVEASLTDTRESLARCSQVEAAHYATFHHKRVVEGRDELLRLLAAYADVLTRREQAVLDLLTEPRELDELVGQGIVYRPGKVPAYAVESERRMVARHLDELVLRGAVLHEDERYALM